MHVVSVFGPFNSRALVEMSIDEAGQLFPDQDLAAVGPTLMTGAVEREIEALRLRSPEIADSALAASALSMAFEMDHPYNSATSKSMCQGRLADALRELRDLSPIEQKKDDLDAQRARRAARLAGRSAAKG